MRKRPLEAQAPVENHEDNLLDGIKSHMRQSVRVDEVFCVEFEVN